MRYMTIIGICGLGVVGRALEYSFSKHNLALCVYDKYKTGYDRFEPILTTHIVFLTLPTPFLEEEYDLTALYDVLTKLDFSSYTGLVVIKSTIVPGTMRCLHERYPSLKLLHNPEFLSAKTALHDFDHQQHIVIGAKYADTDESQQLYQFYKTYWSDVQYSLCIWEESELMKISCNAFYAVKIQFFNEIYQLAHSFAHNCSYENVVVMMIRNGWISPHHVQVPGTDGKCSYGGMCFPKDTKALLHCMLKKNIPHAVLKATVQERDAMRNDESCDKK